MLSAYMFTAPVQNSLQLLKVQILAMLRVVWWWVEFLGRSCYRGTGEKVLVGAAKCQSFCSVSFSDIVSAEFVRDVACVCYRMGFALGLGVLPQEMLKGKLDQVQKLLVSLWNHLS